MRPILTPLLLAPLALSSPNAVLAPFEAGLAQQLPATSDNNSSLTDDDSSLFARQNTNACATNYYACAALNAPGLCCPRTAICTADANLNVACCPQGAQCTGTLLAPNPASPTPSSPPPITPAQTTTQRPNVPSSAAPQPSTVQNPFYPFPYIPTTYADAPACSAAYTSCARDAASCTTALANGAQGVAVSAPNGAGATITAIPSVGLQSAQSICASLSALACSGLQVEACRSFGGGNAAPTRACGGGYLMGVGVVVGVAGGMLQVHG